MARANRHFIPGHIWHLTHRCHKREFIFKFSKDPTRWIELLYEAKKRYRLIDHDKLQGLLNADSNETLFRTHRGWIESQLKAKPERQEHFGRSLAVGSEAFIRRVQQSLGLRAVGRRTIKRRQPDIS